MKTPDLEKERSEKKLTIGDFLKTYNDDLPTEFPRASIPSLKEFRETFPGFFKRDETWSLEQHRKKFMDWLPQYIRSLLR